MHPLKTLKLPQDVEEIYCGQAMAALRKDGSVITWGHSSFGGDSRAVQAWDANFWSGVDTAAF